MSNRKAVGIDLGTTFSAVAHIDAYGKPQIVPNSESERITVDRHPWDARRSGIEKAHQKIPMFCCEENDGPVLPFFALRAI